MKRFSIVLLTLCLLLAGCNAPSHPRTIDVSSSITDNGSAFSYSYDLDFDGKAETIKMEIVWNEDEPWDSLLSVTAGDYNTQLSMMDGMIDAVYICDIDTGDGVYDIAVITNEASNDPRLRILNYSKDFSAYNFGSTEGELWLGYAVSYHLNVNNDNTITIEEQTPSYGMWSVYKTYAINEDGTYEEIVPEYYEILPDFMEKAYLENIDGEELEMWKKGYIKAYSDYDDGTLAIKTGEYVKPLYDNGKNKIYLEKENGEKGWMNMDYADGYNPSEFNQRFFFLAG